MRKPRHLRSRASNEAAREVAQTRDHVQGDKMQNDPKRFWIYITASEPRSVLYIGMTSNLAERAWQHRERVLEGFTKKYGAGRLVYFEEHSNAAVAATRERAMKR